MFRIVTAVLFLLLTMATSVPGIAGELKRAQVSRPTPKSAALSSKQQRFIVAYRTSAGHKMSSRDIAATVEKAARRAGLTQRSGKSPGSASDTLSAVHLRDLAIGASLIRVSRALTPDETQALLRQIKADPAVQRVEPDVMLQHTGRPPDMSRWVPTNFVPDDYEFARQWHLHGLTGGIRAPGAWSRATGEGVVVAVLDTGITPHPDLDANVLEGYDFITDATISRRPTNERVAGALDYGDWSAAGECFPGSPARDSSWHGTHVTGTVAELTNNEGQGGAGVAFKAKVLPVRVLGRCGGMTSDIVDAIVWASGGSVSGVPANAQPAEVINLSLGGLGECVNDSFTQEAIDAAVSAGTTVVVAAGNDAAPAQYFTPASCANVISVGATGYAGRVAPYTNFGDAVDLAAPGGSGNINEPDNGFIWQAWHESPREPQPGFSTFHGMSGTSMATPHVSGVVALIQSIAPTPLTPAQVETVLKETARAPSFPPPGNEFLELITLGAGNLDAARAVARVAPCEFETCLPDEITPIALNAPVTQLSGTPGYEWTFKLKVSRPTENVTVLTYGGSGDVELLASFGGIPTETTAQYRSSRPGNNELIQIPTPRPGNYYIKVRGIADSSADVTLVAR